MSFREFFAVMYIDSGIDFDGQPHEAFELAAEEYIKYCDKNGITPRYE